MRAVGASRDKRVLDGLEKFRYMTTPQVAELYFSNIKDMGQRNKKASERMKVMFDRGYTNRYRFPNMPLIHSLKERRYSSHVDHYLAIVGAWIIIKALRPSGSTIYSEVEYKQEGLQTDLYIEYRNEFRKERKDFFIEVEVNSNADLIEKLKRYEALEWTRNIENACPSVLVFVYEKSRTLKKLEGYDGELEFNAINVTELNERWHW